MSNDPPPYLEFRDKAESTFPTSYHTMYVYVNVHVGVYTSVYKYLIIKDFFLEMSKNFGKLSKRVIRSDHEDSKSNTHRLSNSCQFCLIKRHARTRPAALSAIYLIVLLVSCCLIFETSNVIWRYLQFKVTKAVFFLL